MQDTSLSLELVHSQPKKYNQLVAAITFLFETFFLDMAGPK